nr:uncharacterized protein LOC109774205 isoform X3 [Aegilops tauschii subsp. strangulata]
MTIRGSNVERFASSACLDFGPAAPVTTTSSLLPFLPRSAAGSNAFSSVQSLPPVTESFMPYALLLHRPGRSQPPPRAVLQHSAKPFYAAAREVNEASGPAATCATEYKCLQFAHQNVE